MSSLVDNSTACPHFKRENGGLGIYIFFFFLIFFTDEVINRFYTEINVKWIKTRLLRTNELFLIYINSSMQIPVSIYIAIGMPLNIIIKGVLQRL